MRSALVVLTVLLVRASGLVAQVHAGDSTGVAQRVAFDDPLQTADSVFVVERGSSRVDTWDLLEFPFHVLQAPFWLLGKGLEGIAVVAERTSLPMGVRRLQAVGVYPQISGQGKASGLGAGLLIGIRARPKRLWGYVRGGITTREYWGAELLLGYSGTEPRQALGKPAGTATTRPPRSPDAPRFGVLGVARTGLRARDSYYGIGINSLEADRADYSLERDLAGGELYYRITSHLTLDLDARWERDLSGSGKDTGLPDVDEIFPPQEISGYGQTQTQIVTGGYLEWRTGWPHTKQRLNRWVDLGYHWNESTTAGSADFGHFAGSAGIEIPLARRRLGLFFAVQYESVRPTGEGEIPFYELPALGGKGQLPAYAAFRFRDRDLLVGKAEYRWRVWSDPLDTMWLEAALVLYGGTVEHSMGQDFTFSDVKESYGLNLSLIGQRSELGRIEFANGAEGFRVTLSFGVTI